MNLNQVHHGDAAEAALTNASLDKQRTWTGFPDREVVVREVSHRLMPLFDK